MGTVLAVIAAGLIVRALILMGNDDADRACRFWALAVLCTGSWAVFF